jgi:hypothetical protein
MRAVHIDENKRNKDPWESFMKYSKDETTQIGEVEV